MKQEIVHKVVKIRFVCKDPGLNTHSNDDVTCLNNATCSKYLVRKRQTFYYCLRNLLSLSIGLEVDRKSVEITLLFEVPVCFPLFYLKTLLLFFVNSVVELLLFCCEVTMPNFSNEEYADMLLAYGSANCNAREARRVYQERYPDRRLPHHETFSATYRRLRETGNLNLREPRVNVRQHNVQVDERILRAFDDDPTTSIRVVADRLNLTVWKVWSVLQADRKHAFHYTPVQGNY